MFSDCGGIGIMIDDRADEVIKVLFRSILSKYQNTLFDSADMLRSDVPK